MAIVRRVEVNHQLHDAVQLRVLEIIQGVCAKIGVTIINGAQWCDHIHKFVDIPPHVSVSDFVRRVKGRSSRDVPPEDRQRPKAASNNPA